MNKMQLFYLSQSQLSPNMLKINSGTNSQKQEKLMDFVKNELKLADCSNSIKVSLASNPWKKFS